MTEITDSDREAAMIEQFGKALDLLEAARVGISTAFDLEPVDAFAAPFMEPEAAALVSEMADYLEWAGATPDKCITCGRKLTESAYRLPWCGACIAGESEQSTTAMAAEIERLKAEVERLNLNGIHTCSEECQRVACVQRREIAQLRSEKAELLETATLLDKFAKHDITCAWSKSMEVDPCDCGLRKTRTFLGQQEQRT